MFLLEDIHISFEFSDCVCIFLSIENSRLSSTVKRLWKLRLVRIILSTLTIILAELTHE